MTADLKFLEAIYSNSQTEDELCESLAHHGITREKLLKIANEKGWIPGPIIPAAVFSSTGEVTGKEIKESTKLSLRRMHGILEFAVTKFQHQIRELEPGHIAKTLKGFIEIREKLVNLEFPIYNIPLAKQIDVSFNKKLDEMTDEELLLMATGQLDDSNPS